MHGRHAWRKHAWRRQAWRRQAWQAHGRRTVVPDQLREVLPLRPRLAPVERQGEGAVGPHHRVPLRVQRVRVVEGPPERALRPGGGAARRLRALPLHHRGDAQRAATVLRRVDASGVHHRRVQEQHVARLSQNRST
jgi:hypothetical protein